MDQINAPSGIPWHKIPLLDPNVPPVNFFFLIHSYGPLGVAGVLSFYGGYTYFWYKTSLFTGKKFYNHVLLGERQWMYEAER